jgi:hypothetical protein
MAEIVPSARRGRSSAKTLRSFFSFDETAMATSLFHVKVAEVRDTRVVLNLRIITGEQPDFDSGPGFALMLLYDPIVKKLVSDAPLGREFTAEDTRDSEWVDEHMDEYILSDSLEDVKNLPITEDLESMSLKQRRDFFKSSRAPTARFHITVTRPEWVAHLRKGMEWDSAAYDSLMM